MATVALVGLWTWRGQEPKPTTPAEPAPEAAAELPLATVADLADDVTPAAPGLPGNATELLAAQAHLSSLAPTATPAEHLASLVEVLALRCHLQDILPALQPPDCTAGLSWVPPEGEPVRPDRENPAASAADLAFVAALDASFLAASRPTVVAGLLQLYGEQLSLSAPMRIRLEALAGGLQGPIANMASMVLLGRASAPDPATRELAGRLLRQGHGMTVMPVCEYLGRVEWSDTAGHPAWLVEQIVAPTQRTHARHCLVGALEKLGARQALGDLSALLAEGTRGDLLVRAAARAALARLPAPRRKGRRSAN